MNKLVIVAALAVALAGCNAQQAANLQLTVDTDVDTALAVICPVVAQVEAAQAAGTLDAPNTNVKAALRALDAACPPNLPPTSLVTATSALIQAYVAIEPLLAQIKK